MKKLKRARGVSFIFEEGCNKYLEFCRQRNLSKEIFFLLVFVNVNVLSARNLFVYSKSLFYKLYLLDIFH